MQSSPKWCFLALLFISLSTPFFAISQQGVIPIYLRDDVYHDYVRFLDGETLDKINGFGGKFIRCDVVDMSIAQKVLHLGGLKKTL
ncbi:hypothetical protein [Pseudoalteromonas sp. ZZD1]|uniref:hypothetical protein n=1 Tax=Pseudoalteromonas sp. ZZD1 TaxID=3139395 RepID=UPI003BAA7867